MSDRWENAYTFLEHVKTSYEEPFEENSVVKCVERLITEIYTQAIFDWMDSSILLELRPEKESLYKRRLKKAEIFLKEDPYGFLSEKTDIEYPDLIIILKKRISEFNTEEKYKNFRKKYYGGC